MTTKLNRNKMLRIIAKELCVNFRTLYGLKVATLFKYFDKVATFAIL